MLPIDDDVDAHDVVLVHMFVAGNSDDEHDDFTTDDAMLLDVNKYDTSLILWCKITVISSVIVGISEISLVESYTVHMPTI